MRRRAALAAAGLAAVAALAASAQAVPPALAVVQAWNVAPVEALLPGPGAGVLTVSASPSRHSIMRTTAFRVDGRVLWRRVRDASCGNCEAGPHPLRLQPGGTYGPIGFTGVAAWAYDRAGRQRPACAGGLDADGLCIETTFVDVERPEEDPFPRPAAGLVARRSGAVVWERALPDLDLFLPPPALARDDAGRAYTTLWRAPNPADPIESVLVAAAPDDGRELFRLGGPSSVLAGLPAGVIARDSAGLLAVGAGGRIAWRRAIPERARLRPQDVRVDDTRNAAYISVPAGRPRVVALAASTGKARWATRTRDRASLAAVGPDGRVYVTEEAGTRRDLVALTPAGRVAWRFIAPPGGVVTAATPLARGRVAAVLAPEHGPPSRALILRPPR